MSDAGETFFTSIGCMDGRVADPVAEFGRDKFGAAFADTITEAGLVGLLAADNTEAELLNSIKKKVLISVEKHHSKGIVVHGHQDCAGNLVDDEKHKEDILKTAEIVKGFVPQDIPVVPVFVVKEEGWKILSL